MRHRLAVLLRQLADRVEPSGWEPWMEYYIRPEDLPNITESQRQAAADWAKTRGL